MFSPKIRCRRFWLSQGDDPDLSDGGFLVDPEFQTIHNPSKAQTLESVRDFSVLALLGEPGLGKSTTLEAEYRQIRAEASERGAQFSWSDLSLLGTSSEVRQEVFEKSRLQCQQGSNVVFLDGFDECLRRIDNLVPILLDLFSKLDRDRLSLRIACRTAEWPSDLEGGLRELWAARQ